MATHLKAKPSDPDGMLAHISLSTTTMFVASAYCARQSGNAQEQVQRTVLTRFTANGTRFRSKTIPARSFLPSSSAYTRSAEKPEPRLSEWCRRGCAGKWYSHAKHRNWVRVRAEPTYMLTSQLQNVSCQKSGFDGKEHALLPGEKKISACQEWQNACK